LAWAALAAWALAAWAAWALATATTLAWAAATVLVVTLALAGALAPSGLLCRVLASDEPLARSGGPHATASSARCASLGCRVASRRLGPHGARSRARDRNRPAQLGEAHRGGHQERAQLVFVLEDLALELLHDELVPLANLVGAIAPVEGGGGKGGGRQAVGPRAGHHDAGERGAQAAGEHELARDAAQPRVADGKWQAVERPVVALAVEQADGQRAAVDAVAAEAADGALGMDAAAAAGAGGVFLGQVGQPALAAAAARARAAEHGRHQAGQLGLRARGGRRPAGGRDGAHQGVEGGRGLARRARLDGQGFGLTRRARLDGQLARRERGQVGWADRRAPRRLQQPGPGRRLGAGGLGGVEGRRPAAAQGVRQHHFGVPLYRLASTRLGATRRGGGLGLAQRRAPPQKENPPPRRGGGGDPVRAGRPPCARVGYAGAGAGRTGRRLGSRRVDSRRKLRSCASA